MDKLLILVTGPIGAGKSTFSEILVRHYPFKKMEYISTDLYYGVYFRENYHSEADNYAMAKKYCWYKLNKAVSMGRSFIWETVVAKKDKIDFLKKCCDLGYRIVVVFISVNSLPLLTARVAKRHEQGWYDVPLSKIEDRFLMVKKNIATLEQLSDEFIMINASDHYKTMVLVRN